VAKEIGAKFKKQQFKAFQEKNLDAIIWNALSEANL